MARLRFKVIERPRLIELIDQHGGQPVLLITAPAGYGKTTLARQWINHLHDARVCWIDARSVPVTPNGFVSTLWQSVLATDESSQPASEAPDINALIGLLARQTSPTVIVLEDFHHYQDACLLESIASVINRLPAHVRLMILSRQSPRMELVRRWAYGEMFVLAKEDLAFTLDETREALVNLDLADAQVARLHRETLGWIVGIRMLLLSAGEHGKDYEAKLDLVISNVGESRPLNVFVREELLNQMSEDLRQFVLNTSFLRWLDVDLCNAVLDIQHSDDYLHELEASFFLTRPENPRHLQFHPILAKAARRLRVFYGLPLKPTELYARAAAFFEQRHEWERALYIHFEAEAWKPAAHLLKNIKDRLLEDPALQRLLDRVHELPEPILRADDELLSIAIRSHLLAGNVNAARPLLRWMTEVVGSGATPLEKGLLANARARVAYLDGDPDDAVRQALLALSTIPREHTYDRLRAWIGLFNAEIDRGNLRIAEGAMKQARAIRERVPGAAFDRTMDSTGEIANAAALSGDLDRAEALLLHQIDQLTSSDIHPRGRLGHMLLHLYVEQNRLEAAECEARMLREHMASHEYRIWYPNAHVSIIRLLMAQGALDQIPEFLRAGLRMSYEYGGLAHVRQMEACQAHFWLQTGRSDLADYWLSSTELPPPLVRWFGDFNAHSVRLGVLVNQQQYEEAQTLVEQLLKLARERRHLQGEVEFSTWASIIAERIGNVKLARSHLKHALELGAPGKFHRIYFPAGHDLRENIGALAPQLNDVARVHAYSVSGITSASQAPDPTPALGLDSRIDLTDREIDVLRELIAGKTNREIAESLFITERTVKKHLANLFRKSGATNRTSVVVWASQIFESSIN